MPKQVRTHMTPLDRALAISARREGMCIEEIADIFNRDELTIQRLLRRNNVIKGDRRGENQIKSTFKHRSWYKSKGLTRVQKSRPDIAARNRDGARLACDDGRREEVRPLQLA